MERRMLLGLGRVIDQEEQQVLSPLKLEVDNDIFKNEDGRSFAKPDRTNLL